MKYTFVFFTHAGAIQFKRKCDQQEISCTLMPVPRKLSSNCGIGAQVVLQGEIFSLIDEEVEKVFQGEVAEAELVYEAE